MSDFHIQKEKPTHESPQENFLFPLRSKEPVSRSEASEPVFLKSCQASKLERKK